MGAVKGKNYRHGELTFMAKVFIYLLILLGLFIFMFPLFWMITTSLKTQGAVFKLPPEWFPYPLQWENYKHVFQDHPFARYMSNTIGYSVITIIATVFTSALVAFAFARLRARGSNILFALVLSTMMLPQQVTMVPQYLIFNKLGWVDSYLPLIVPAFGGSPFLIFLLRQFYLGISRELDDAVKIDGGGYLTLFFKILLPLSIPAMATAAIMEFMFRWNDLMGPLIYLHTSKLYPLSLGLANFTASYAQTPWHTLMAASVLAILPPLILFFFAQKYFIRGIVITGTKG